MKATKISHTNRNTAGFTLVELMVVLFIFGLMAGAVVLTLPTRDRAIIADAEKFAAKVAALRDNAILQSRPMAVQVTASGYSFTERRKGNWLTMKDKPFVPENWSPGVEASNLETTNNSQRRGALFISFESTGLPVEPAQIILTFEDAKQMIVLDQVGDVRLSEASRLEEP